MRFTCTIALLLLSALLRAQPLVPEFEKITLIQPPSITLLLDEHKEFIRKIETIPGYRIQIRTFTRLQEASKALAEFQRAYPDIKAYLLFIEPNYRLRAGDFPDRVEATRVLHQIRRKYPECFVVKDEVRLDAL